MSINEYPYCPLTKQLCRAGLVYTGDEAKGEEAYCAFWHRFSAFGAHFSAFAPGAVSNRYIAGTFASPWPIQQSEGEGRAWQRGTKSSSSRGTSERKLRFAARTQYSHPTALFWLKFMHRKKKLQKSVSKNCGSSSGEPLIISKPTSVFWASIRYRV